MVDQGTPGRLRSCSEENVMVKQAVDPWSRGSKQDRFSGHGGLYNRQAAEQAHKGPRRRSLQKEFAAGASPTTRDSPRRASGLRRASSCTSGETSPALRKGLTSQPIKPEKQEAPVLDEVASTVAGLPEPATVRADTRIQTETLSTAAATVVPSIDSEVGRLQAMLQESQDAAIDCLIGGMVRTAAAAAIAEVVAREGNFMASLVVVAAAKAEHAVTMLQQALVEPGRQHETGISTALSSTLSGSLPASPRGSEADRSTPPPSASVIERISGDLADLQRSRQTPELSYRASFQAEISAAPIRCSASGAWLYSVVVRKHGRVVHTVARRYSELRAMHRKLSSSPSCAPSLPDFPPARWYHGWYRSQDVGFAERRRAELDGYLRELLASRVLQAHVAVRATLELA